MKTPIKISVNRILVLLWVVFVFVHLVKELYLVFVGNHHTALFGQTGAGCSYFKEAGALKRDFSQV